MTKKKNRLFTFFCSLIPGAGEMYLGFFKHGLSVMTLFFLLMFFSSMLFPPLMFLAPVLWFYSFFHVDRFIQDRNLLLTKYRKVTSYALIFLGAAILWQNLSDFIQMFFSRYLSIPEPIQSLLFWINRRIPQMAIALGIILLGFWLIKQKKKDLFLTDGNGGDISEGPDMGK